LYRFCIGKKGGNFLIFGETQEAALEAAEKAINAIKDDEVLTYNLIDLVDTVPDDTQDQIMHVMEQVGYRNVAILNLSDIRDTDSSNFVKQVDKLNHKELGVVHSIFDNTRKKELDYILSLCDNKPIIFASGVNYKLRFLTNHALTFFDTDKVYGWKKNYENQHINLYFHPLPRSQQERDSWIKIVCAQITSTRS